MPVSLPINNILYLSSTYFYKGVSDTFPYNYPGADGVHTYILWKLWKGLLFLAQKLSGLGSYCCNHRMDVASPDCGTDNM